MAEEKESADARSAEEMERLILKDGRYPLDAYAFLHDGLALAVKRTHKDRKTERGKRHVTGAQLCESLRDLAVERWGPLACTVLRRWRISGTIDFGQMVYLLVDNGFMQKTDEDSLEDFRDVYDFAKVFPTTARFELKE